MAMKLTLAYPLYTRKTASNEMPPLGYLDDGTVIEVEEVVVGKAIDSNSVWFRTTENVFYWSGGVGNYEFVFPGSDFIQLPLKQQQELVAQAMTYYYQKLSEKVQGFTGMSVGFKMTEGHFTNHYALIVQVQQKSDNPSYYIPGTLPFLGFAIPTDVVEASETESSGLGDSIARKGKVSFGSAGFITTKESSTAELLITNYHVACADLMLRSPRKLSFEAGNDIKEPTVVMPAGSSKAIGTVIEGRLDQFNDVAIIKLDSAIANNIPVIGPIREIRTLESIEENFRPGTIRVRMFGAKSKQETTGFIVSLNSTQTISYLDNTFKHELKALIQVTRISKRGDSGSAVVDDANKLIGILVGADSAFSYILPVENILFNFTLNNP